jgi:flagellar hook-associated protein FlgK
MGKVTPSKFTSSLSSSAKGRSTKSEGKLAKSVTASQRSRISASPPPQVQRTKVNVGAATLIQQLSEVNRRLGSGATDSNSMAPLQSRRDALVGELEQHWSVDVIHRSDGSIRVRTVEGRVLFDSTEGNEMEFNPGLSNTNDVATPVVPTPQALESYVRSEQGISNGPEEVENTSALMVEKPSVKISVSHSAQMASVQAPVSEPVVLQTLDQISSPQALQEQIQIVGLLEESLTQSRISLSSASLAADSIESLLG